MSTFSDPSYKRSEGVQAEIDRMLPLPHSDWIAQALELRNETLVFLIRQAGNSDPEVYGTLFRELGRRITPFARRATRGLDRATAQEIVLKVEIDILELIVSDRPSRKRDFLEIAFAAAVEGRAIDLIRIHRNSPLGHLGEIMADPVDDDGDEIERPIELAPDGGPSPEEIVIALDNEARRKEWFRKACDAVKDPRHREAVLLHVTEDMPILSKDPNTLDIVRHFEAIGVQARPAQVKYWVAAGLKVIRKTFGIQPGGEKQ